MTVRFYTDYCGTDVRCQNGGTCSNQDDVNQPFLCTCPDDAHGQFCQLGMVYCPYSYGLLFLTHPLLLKVFVSASI